MMSAPSPTPPTRHHLLHSHHNAHHPHHSTTNASNTPISNSTNNCSASSPASNNLDSLEDKHSLKMKIKRTKPPTKTSEAKHEIVKPLESDNGDSPALNHNQVPLNSVVSTPANIHLNLNSNSQVEANGSAHSISRQNVVKHNHKKEKRRHDVNGSLQSVNNQHQLGSSLHNPSQKHATSLQQMPPMSSAGGLQGPPMTSSCLSTNTKQTATPVKSGGIATPQHTPLRTDTLPPAKRLKIGEEASGPSFGGSSGGTTSYRDVCVGTSVGTITEPDCLGPCEPGTSVTLEGIVWHETQGGVLVVNVTWRGKTYVGTLLDCTQHDWAPPRFCDSPNTEDMDSRTPKGRGKRGRYGGGNVQTSQSSGTSGAGSSAISGSSGGNGGNNQTSSNSTSNTSTNDVGNVTETRSGKVRGNQPQKGRRGGGNNSGNSFATPNSPQNTAANKRKGRDTDVLNSNDLKNKKGRMSGKITDGSADNSPDNSNSASQAADDAAPLTVSSPAQSPQYIECPEPNCSKKYKHMNGLKYHQNHAHNSTEEDGCGQVDGDDSGNLVSEEVCTESHVPTDSSEETSQSKSSGNNSASDLTNNSYGSYSNRSSPALTNNVSSSDAASAISGMAVSREISTINKPVTSARIGVTAASQTVSLEEHQSEKYEQFAHSQCPKPPMYQQRSVPHLVSTQSSSYHPSPSHQDGPLMSEQTYSSVQTIYSHSSSSAGYALGSPVVSHPSHSSHPSSPLQNSSCPNSEETHSSVIARLPQAPTHPMYYYPPNSLGLLRPGLSQSSSVQGMPGTTIRSNPVIRPGIMGSAVQARQPVPHVISNAPASISSAPRPTLLLSTPQSTQLSTLPGSPHVKNGTSKTSRESGEDEDPRSPAYSDISDAADAPSIEGEASNNNPVDRKDNPVKPDQLLIQPSGPFVGIGAVYGQYESSFPPHSPYLLRYNPTHPMSKQPEMKENCKVGDEKKEAQDSTNFQAGPPSFPGGLYPYAGGLAPPPHYTSDPYYAHLAHSLPPVAQAAPVDVSHPSSKEVSGLPVPNLSAPKLGSGSPYQASLDPRLLHPLLSTGLPLPVRLPHPVDNSHSKDGEAGPLSLENKITAPSSDNDNREGPNSLDATASSSGSSFSQT
ncbi:zinc finger protein 609 isoform X2 [Hyalella azteca]|uniref:Zinc finger protein 609 isoform X2 n=1 Tax=Hyalella azteca TaxID=294128 RepID=A0A8B7N7B0_HYAAZ|nr:zinc finger protein 609 isoform X2 [Hyalella azteca]